MKKIWLLTTLLMCCFVFVWCGNNQQQKINKNSSILTWGFSPAPQKEEKKILEPEQPEIPEKFKDIDFSKIGVRTINLQELTPQERQYLNEHLDWDKLSVDERTYLIHGHDPFEYEEKAGTYSVKSKIVHEWCSKYVNNEFWFQIDLSKWNDCKITYSETLDLDWNFISRRFNFWSQPLNDYWWFEWWGDFAWIVILAKDEEIKDRDPLFNYDAVDAENNKYNFYLILWSASDSFFYTYVPTKYEDFICEWAHEGEERIIFDSNWCHCGAADSDWEILGIDMPKPARNIRCIALNLIKNNFSVFDI